MSEEIKKMSAFKAFAQTQQTFAEAEEKAKLEAGTPKVERFRIGEDGEYSLRILPLAPNFDEEGNILPMERKGYEYPVHQFFLSIKVPAKKGGKAKKISIPVIRTTDKEVGYSVDLIDTYLKIAKEMYADDDELIKLITGNSFGGGLRWNYQHAIMVLDVSSSKERKKGPLLWQCSHSQYKDIDAAKMRLWKELREDGEQETCPISGFTDAYPVKIIRTTDKKTEYTVEIGRKTLDIEEEEAEKLLELPRIPEQIYRYTRYQMEATLEFLKQYDEEHQMEVCKEPDFVEAVEKLSGELSPEDNSHFNVNEAGAKDNGKDELTLDSLWNEYDAIIDQDLGEKSDEYQELREKIRQYIEDKNLDVRISRTKSNQELLTAIEEAEEAKAKEPKKEEEKPAPKSRPTTPRPKVKEEKEEEDEDNDGDIDDQDNDDDSDSKKEEEKPAAPPRRRPRPGTEAPEEKEEDPKSEEVEESEEKEDAEEESSRRRLHKRRLR